MDVLPRITGQLIELFRQMSLLQRTISVAATAAVLFGFVYLLICNRSDDLQPVASGKLFAPAELSLAEKTLTSAGFHGFRRDGQRLLVPAAELDQYNAALSQASEQSTDLGSQILKQYESLGPFSTDRQRQQLKEALLLQELRQTIRAVPDVEDARVAIATPERRFSWNERPRTTASVSVKLRNEREISANLVNSLKQVVANMVPDLKPADVTVFDLTRGQAYTGELTEASPAAQSAQRAQEFAQEYARQYEHQIAKALSHVPNVGVHVQVDLETLRTESQRVRTVNAASAANTAGRQTCIGDEDSTSYQTGFRGSDEEGRRKHRDEAMIAALPKSIQVSVSIPRDYLRELITHRKARNERSADRLNPELLEEEVLTKVERIVDRMVPPGLPPEAVSVMFVDSIAQEGSPSGPLITQERLIQWTQQWGGALAIGCLCLFLIAFLWRSGAGSNHVEFNASEPTSAPQIPSDSVIAEFNSQFASSSPDLSFDRAAILRDEVRSLVKTDPVATAAILNQWVSEAAA